MNTPSTIAAIVAAAAASAGITWFATKDEPTPSPEAPEAVAATTTSTPDFVPTPAVEEVSLSGETPWSGDDSTVAKEERAETGAPNGIDDETWERAEQRVNLISSFAQMARNSGMFEARMEERVTRDATRIQQQLGLEGESAEKVEELLTLRMDASTSRSREMFDAMLTNKEGLTELLAMGEMEMEDSELTPVLSARKSELKKSMFGQFYQDGEEMTDDELRGLFRPTRPSDWYDDEQFVAAAAAELGGQKGTELQEYAQKMDYLDREQRAYRSINNIERNVQLQPEQQQNLMQLYIDNPNPSNEQLGQVLTPEQVQQVKESNNNSGRGWWGRGRGR